MNKYVKNTLYTFISNILIFILTFIFTPLIISKLGGEAYGVWTFLLLFSIGGIVSYFDFGFQGAAEKRISEYHAQDNWQGINSAASVTLVLFSAIGIILAALIFLLSSFVFLIFKIPEQFHTEVIASIYVFSISNLIVFPCLTLNSILAGLQRYDFTAKVNLIYKIVFNVGIIIVLILNGSLVGMSVFFSVSYLVIPVCYLFFLLKKYPLLKFRLSYVKKDAFLDLTRNSSALFLSRVTGLLFNYVDKILISVFLNMTVMALYEIVNRVYSLASFFSSFLRTATLSYSAELASKNREDDLHQFFFTTTKIDAVLTFSACVFFFVIGERFVSLWTSGAFNDVGIYIVFALGSYFLINWIVYVPYLLLAKDIFLKYIWISILATLMKVIVSFILVLPLGIIGIYIGTLSGYFFNFVLYMVIVFKVVKLSVRHFVEDFLRIAIAIAVLSITLLIAFSLYTPQSILGIVFGLAAVAVVYMPVLWFVIFSKSEKQFFIRQLKLKMNK